MAASGSVKTIDRGGPRLVHYLSVVELCDRIRMAYNLPDRRPQVSVMRHRDEDLLPFPLRETIGAQTALRTLGLGQLEEVLRLIEQGRFEAYRLAPDAPWRISRPSLLTYIEYTRRASSSR